MGSGRLVTNDSRNWMGVDYIIDTMDDDGVRALSLTCIKKAVPEKFRSEVPMLLDILVENSTLVRVKKDYYVKAINH